MPMTLPRLTSRGLLLGLSLFATQALAAPDAKGIADSLVAAMTATGKTQASYDSATANGDAVTIAGYKMTNADGDTITIPSLVINGAAERDKGGFTADHISFDGGTLVSGSETSTWQTGGVDDALVPSPDEIKAKAHVTPFSAIKVGGINVSGPDIAAPIAVNAVAVELDALPDGTPRSFALTVDGIKIPAAVFDDHPQQKAVIDALGYTGFVTTLEVKGGYDTKADTLTLDSFALDTVDVGKLTILAKISGVSLGKLVADEKTADVQSKGKLESLSIRFDNSGIVERALDMQAKMMGGTRDDEVAQITGAMPFMLNIIGNAAFQDKISAAVTAFLKEPKSIAISAAPKEPVGFDKISEAAQGSPQTLPDLLGADVTANQ